jgi:hypothetical protein
MKTRKNGRQNETNTQERKKEKIKEHEIKEERKN